MQFQIGSHSLVLKVSHYCAYGRLGKYAFSIDELEYVRGSGYKLIEIERSQPDCIGLLLWKVQIWLYDYEYTPVEED